MVIAIADPLMDRSGAVRPPILCLPLPQVGLLSYSHRPSPLFPLNSSYEPSVLLQKIQDIPYMDPSGNNLGQCCYSCGLLDIPLESMGPQSHHSALHPPGTAVVTAHRYLLAPDAPGRRPQVPGVMVLLVDEALRGDVFSSIREAQAAGEQRS